MRKKNLKPSFELSKLSFMLCAFDKFSLQKLIPFFKYTSSASSCITTVLLCSQPFRASTMSWSNCLMNTEREFVQNKLLIWPRSSLWCWYEAQSKLWFPTSSAIDFMYLFPNFPESLFRIALADTVLETKTCVPPNMLVMKQLPYLRVMLCC